MKKSRLIISLIVVWALLGLGPVGSAPQLSWAPLRECPPVLRAGSGI